MKTWIKKNWNLFLAAFAGAFAATPARIALAAVGLSAVIAGGLYNATTSSAGFETPAQVTKLTGLGNPLLTSRFLEDFENNAGATVSTTVTTAGGWLAAGGGSCATVPSNANTDTEVGVVQLSTLASTTGTCSLYRSPTTGNGSYKTSTAADLDMDFKVQVPTLSNSTDNFSLLVGVVDSATPANGVWALVDSNVDSHWSANCMTASTLTSTLSTGTLLAATWTHVRVHKNGGANSVTITVDGANGQTVSTNCPTTAALFPIVRILKGGTGTNPRTALVDFASGVYSGVARAN